MRAPRRRCRSASSAIKSKRGDSISQAHYYYFPCALMCGMVVVWSGVCMHAFEPASAHSVARVALTPAVTAERWTR